MGRERISMDVGNGNTAGQALSAPLRNDDEAHRSITIILMLTSVAASMSNGYWMVNEPSQMGSSSGASCTNQTHSGGALRRHRNRERLLGWDLGLPRLIKCSRPCRRGGS